MNISEKVLTSLGLRVENYCQTKNFQRIDYRPPQLVFLRTIEYGVFIEGRMAVVLNMPSRLAWFSNS
jgi:hypothetical protein